MKTTISFFILLVAIEISNVIEAQVSVTNADINQTNLINSHNRAANTFVPTILDTETNYSGIYSNDVIPLIQFRNVPLDIALEELIQQTGLKIGISSRIMGSIVTGDFMEFDGVVVHNQKIKDKNNLPDSRFVPMPNLSLSWTNVTAKQGLNAICQKFNLIIITDTNGLLRIEPKEVKKGQHIE